MRRSGRRSERSPWPSHVGCGSSASLINPMVRLRAASVEQEALMCVQLTGYGKPVRRARPRPSGSNVDRRIAGQTCRRATSHYPRSVFQSQPDARIREGLAGRLVCGSDARGCCASKRGVRSVSVRQAAADVPRGYPGDFEAVEYILDHQITLNPAPSPGVSNRWRSKGPSPSGIATRCESRPRLFCAPQSRIATVSGEHVCWNWPPAVLPTFA